MDTLRVRARALAHAIFLNRRAATAAFAMTENCRNLAAFALRNGRTDNACTGP